MPNNRNNDRHPAYDTGPIPKGALSKQEKDIIWGINGLLRRIKDATNESTVHSKCETSKDEIWANPTRQLNNIILLDGERGIGKTSLLNTVIAGWSNPKKFKKNKNGDIDLGFKGMKKIIRTLQPIDFDPLPPDLPVYSWIIQAFYPLVQRLTGRDQARFLEDEDYDKNDSSIMGIYRKLQQAATIGWTTGLLKQSLGKDAAEFLLWQEEQQVNWQRLRKVWRKFINRLLVEMENSNTIDPHGKIPQGSLIVLPIDDLDLQVTRVRELLLALRVLRHERLVYILTGDKENTDLALITSFYRDFISEIPVMSDESIDKVMERSELLGRPLRQKTIPDSQTFSIGGIDIDDAMDWSPPNFETQAVDGDSATLGEILDGMFGKHESIKSISEFIKAR